MEIAVYNVEGIDTGKKVTLKDGVFGIEPNEHAVYLDVKQHLANSRQGTHKSKERSEIVGSTRKIKKQKGTGTARAGSIKSPLFRGGGRAFGPRPRDYGFKLNKKVKQLARKSALSYKFTSQSLIVVEDFNFETPKTKEMVNVCNSLKLNDKKALIVSKDKINNVYLSSRNLNYVAVSTISETTTYDIVKASTLVLTESSVDFLNELLG